MDSIQNVRREGAKCLTAHSRQIAGCAIFIQSKWNAEILSAAFLAGLPQLATIPPADESILQPGSFRVLLAIYRYYYCRRHKEITKLDDGGQARLPHDQNSPSVLSWI
ncbi:hypothetical protein CBL_12411 [Carabus blaptoides fortunei]